MNVGIGHEAAEFHFCEYLFRIFGIVYSVLGAAHLSFTTNCRKILHCQYIDHKIDKRFAIVFISLKPVNA
jgi:hypothetical protein